ncbi:MAG: glycerol kinase GlpK [candidate division FCPU426 bacterium]
MDVILALDQGTTGSRAILYSVQGRAVAQAYHEFPQYYPRPGWVEHDALEIWASVRRSIRETLAQAPLARIVAIGITNQRETTVLWDQQTGQPVHRAIVWQCRRTADRCRELTAEGLGGFFRRRTGLPVDAYFSGTKIEWLLKHMPRCRSLARAGRLRFGTIDTWLLWNLTRGQKHATDFTNASRTLLFNLDRKQWDPDILKKFGIPTGILPDVLPSSGLFGRTAKLGFLPAGLPIAGMAGDQQAALFGQTCFAPGTLKNTYGTGCFMLLNAGTKRPHSRHGLITTLGCDGRGRPVYVLEGSIFIAGAAIQWLRDGLKLLATASESEALARSLPGNEGVYFVPALVGLGAPYWDADARGTIVGLTRGTRREHLVRAALEAMAYATRDVFEAMRLDSGLAVKALQIDGGATANDFLCQFQADVLGLRVVRPRVRELTALGAAYLAGLAVGFWKNADEIKKHWMLDRVFKPRLKPAFVQRLYAGWKDAVERARTRP